MRTIERSSAFKRDYRRVKATPSHSRNVDSLLATVVVALLLDQALPAQNRDHALSGDWAEERFDQDFSVDVATGNQQSLTPAESLAGSLAGVSPDGATILFQRQSIWRMDADGGHKRELAPGSKPAWSRDGKRIAYVDAAGYITTMVADGGDRRRLVRGTLPVWSPDGRRIAYVERRSPVRLMVVGADGSGARSLYSTTDVFLSVLWSPDGTAVVVAADDLIVLLPIAGGTERVLARDIAGLTGPQWSPDGSRLAFARSGRLFTMSASGGWHRRADGSAPGGRRARGGVRLVPAVVP